MQHSAHNASGRREERVPLAAVVSLRDTVLEGEATQLEADGLNVSIGGIAMRARFVPVPGSVIACSFSCPPTGELVSARGEVMWSEPHGTGQGQFGLRFVELDTKSATALRKLVAKDGGDVPKSARSRTAQLRIDGLEASVEAELKLADETRLVLEQPLSFLHLGRGVEVNVPGRGKERGRIASVELRHGRLDVPSLVFGILLDEAPVREVDPAHATNAAWFTGEPELEEPFPGLHAVKSVQPARRTSAWGKPRSVEQAEVSEEEADERPSQAPDRTSELSLDQASARTLDRASARFRDSEARIEAARIALGDRSPTATLQGIGRLSELPSDVQDDELAALVHAEPLSRDSVRATDSVRVGEDPDEGQHQDEDAQAQEHALDRENADEQAQGRAPALTLRTLPAHLRSLFRVPATQLAELRQRLEPALREQAESLDLPDAKSRLLLKVAQLRAFVSALWARYRQTRVETDPAPNKRRPTRLRMQRSTIPGVGPGEEATDGESSRTTRMAAIALTVVGVGLAVYALVPRGSAERIELPARIATAQPSEPELIEAPAEEPLALDIEPKAIEPKPEKKKRKGAAVEAAPVDPVAAVPAFGESEVPNGRVFTLRMNGPITGLEGAAFENGFTVKVPGRTPIDPARPIASAHRAVKRALFMNQGKFAELTIEFLPGYAPRYQVRANGDALEIELERL